MKHVLGKSTVLLWAVLLLFAAQANAQTIRYSYSSDGTEVIDSQTGLTWRRCAEGQTWKGGTCTGSVSSYTHEAALALARDQAAGATGKAWRLPNVKELSIIADKTRNYPAAIDPTAFPGATSDWFWSSSPNAGDPRNAWSVNFGDGYVYHYVRSSSYAVRLVRTSP